VLAVRFNAQHRLPSFKFLAFRSPSPTSLQQSSGSFTINLSRLDTFLNLSRPFQMLLILIPSAFLLYSLPLLSNAGRSHPARFVSGPNTHQRLATRATNLQIFTGALGDILPPAVTYDESLSRPYLVGSRQELDLITALGVSCDDQHSLCAHAANAGGDWTVGECDKQNEGELVPFGIRV
jgi:hypothetical protein